MFVKTTAIIYSMTDIRTYCIFYFISGIFLCKCGAVALQKRGRGFLFSSLKVFHLIFVIILFDTSVLNGHVSASCHMHIIFFLLIAKSSSVAQ